MTKSSYARVDPYQHPVPSPPLSPFPPPPSAAPPTPPLGHDPPLSTDKGDGLSAGGLDFHGVVAVSYTHLRAHETLSDL
eukprot:7965001-Karenia_brevis.AAC.1